MTNLPGPIKPMTDEQIIAIHARVDALLEDLKNACSLHEVDTIDDLQEANVTECLNELNLHGVAYEHTYGTIAQGFAEGHAHQPANIANHCYWVWLRERRVISNPWPAAGTRQVEGWSHHAGFGSYHEAKSSYRSFQAIINSGELFMGRMVLDVAIRYQPSYVIETTESC
jgi:hypothetical protein